jgi:hypothetical protein
MELGDGLRRTAASCEIEMASGERKTEVEVVPQLHEVETKL